MMSIKQKIFDQTFENTASILLVHNFGEYIDYVSVEDANHNRIPVDSFVNEDANQCRITLPAEYSGKAYVISQWLSMTRADGTEFEVSINSEGNLIATEII